jgi:cytochrome P450
MRYTGRGSIRSSRLQPSTGAHLARRQLVIALETWFERVPVFRLGSTPPRIHGGYLVDVDELALRWD